MDNHLDHLSGRLAEFNGRMPVLDISVAPNAAPQKQEKRNSAVHQMLGVTERVFTWLYYDVGGT